MVLVRVELRGSAVPLLLSRAAFLRLWPRLAPFVAGVRLVLVAGDDVDESREVGDRPPAGGDGVALVPFPRRHTP